MRALEPCRSSSRKLNLLGYPPTPPSLLIMIVRARRGSPRHFKVMLLILARSSYDAIAAIRGQLGKRQHFYQDSPLFHIDWTGRMGSRLTTGGGVADKIKQE